jgi:biotin transport system substrate-specific component
MIDVVAFVLLKSSGEEAPVHNLESDASRRKSISSDTPRRISVSRIRVQEMTRIALFTAMAAAAAVLARFGSSIVPFSLVPFVVFLAGATLGPRSGAYSMLMYMCLGLAGLPVFASPPYGGFSYVVTPSFGFIPGFMLAAYVIGKVLEKAASGVREEALESALEKAPDSALQKVSGRTLSRTQGRRERVRTLAAHFIANVAGVLTYYSIGIPYLALILNVYLGQSVSFYRVLQIGLVPFIVPDLVKALVAAVISRALASAGISPQR